MKEKIVNFMALFTSTGTLLCCALPAAIAAVAGGAAVGAYVSYFPWIIPLSRHKGELFLVAGIMISVSGLFTLRPQSKLACAITGGKGCEVAGKFSKTMFWVAAVVYVVGAFMSYGIVPLMRLMDGL